MMIRKLSGLAVLASTLVLATQSFADSKSLELRVEKLAIEEGKVHASVISGAKHAVIPGDKGFFTKGGQKVENSDFEIDRLDDHLAFAKTKFEKLDELPERGELVAHITTTRTCPRGGRTRPELHERPVAQGERPADGYAFAKVTSAHVVHKTLVQLTIDKGSDDGVLPSSSAYALGEGRPRPLSGYVGVTSVGTKTAIVEISAGNAQELAQAAKRIGYERLVCK